MITLCPSGLVFFGPVSEYTAERLQIRGKTHFSTTASGAFIERVEYELFQAVLDFEIRMLLSSFACKVTDF